MNKILLIISLLISGICHSQTLLMSHDDSVRKWGGVTSDGFMICKVAMWPPLTEKEKKILMRRKRRKNPKWVEEHK